MFFFQNLHGFTQESDYVYSHNFYIGKHISRKDKNNKNLVRFMLKMAKTGKKLYFLDFSFDKNNLKQMYCKE